MQNRGMMVEMLMPQYDYFYTFEFSNEYIVYDYYNAVIFEVTRNMYDFLKDYRNLVNVPEYNKERLAFEDLINRGYLLSDEKLDEEIDNDAAYLSFAPSHHCNMRCKYCFAQHGMTYDGDTR